MTKTTPVATASSESDLTRVLERPDGFYWQDMPTEKMYGPFSTRLEAELDMAGQSDNGFEEGESLEDAEAEIGIAGWIDPDTGEPAESLSPRRSDN
jgi:hypothetical protein